MLTTILMKLLFTISNNSLLIPKATDCVVLIPETNISRFIILKASTRAILAIYKVVAFYYPRSERTVL